MRVTLLIDLFDDQIDDLRHDVQTFLHLMARDRWQVSEADGPDDLTLVTVDFHDSLDADDFKLWRNIDQHIWHS
jgi:hypothetical protein